MSEKLKRTIDANLAGLHVTNRDVDAVLMRVRQERAESAGRSRRSGRMSLRVAVVMMAVLLVSGAVLLETNVLNRRAAVPLSDITRSDNWLDADQIELMLDAAAEMGLSLPDGAAEALHLAALDGGCTLETLMETFGLDDHALGQWSLEMQVQFCQALQDAHYTGTLPGMTRLPSDGEISANEALDIAVAYIRAHDDPQADFSDAAYYRVGIRFLSRTGEASSADTVYCLNFDSTNAFGTDYEVTVDAHSGEVLRMHRERGAGDGHTGEEVTRGFSRLFGADMHTWTQQQLRIYTMALADADESSLTTMHELFLLATSAGYPDVDENAISRTDATQLATAALKKNADAEEADVLAAQYLSGNGQPLWKIALRQNEADGTTISYVEIQADTGEVSAIITGGSLYGLSQEFFPNALIERQVATNADGAITPVLTAQEAQQAAEEALYLCYGVEISFIGLDVRIYTDLDPLFSIYTGSTVVLYTEKGAADTAAVYWVALDWYGSVLDLGWNRNPLDVARLALLMEGVVSTAYDESSLPVLQAQLQAALDDPDASFSMERDDYLPVAEALLSQKLVDTTTFSLDEAEEAACRLIGCHTRYSLCNSIISLEVDGQAMWHLCLSTDLGNYVVDLWDRDLSLVEMTQISTTRIPWAARLLPLQVWKTLPEQFTPTVYRYDEPDVVSGMRADHIVQRYIDLYGMNILSWSQAELRSFQQSMSLSDSVVDEMAVPCLQKTTYPDIPEEAISRSLAAFYAADALGESDWTLYGSILIGREEGNPVWKLSLTLTDGRSVNAEVDCLTGEVVSLRERKSGISSLFPDYNALDEETEYWFRDLVLDEVVEQVEREWTSKGHG